MPDMGIKAIRDAAGSYRAPASAAQALFTTTQQRVLGLLFGQPHASFSISELIAQSGSGSGAVQREVASLLAGGLIEVVSAGRQKRYQANPRSPIYSELVSILRKTVGLADPLRTALEPLAPQILAAFIYGSVAKGTEGPGSDVDLLVVSDSITLADLMLAIAPLESELGREVHPTLYSKQELLERRQSKNAFITRVLEQPRIWLIGSDEQIRA